MAKNRFQVHEGGGGKGGGGVGRIGYRSFMPHLKPYHAAYDQCSSTPLHRHDVTYYITLSSQQMLESDSDEDIAENGNFHSRR